MENKDLNNDVNNQPNNLSVDDIFSEPVLTNEPKQEPNVQEEIKPAFDPFTDNVEPVKETNLFGPEEPVVPPMPEVNETTIQEAPVVPPMPEASEAQTVPPMPEVKEEPIITESPTEEPVVLDKKMAKEKGNNETTKFFVLLITLIALIGAIYYLTYAEIIKIPFIDKLNVNEQTTTTEPAQDIQQEQTVENDEPVQEAQHEEAPVVEDESNVDNQNPAEPAPKAERPNPVRPETQNLN